MQKYLLGLLLLWVIAGCRDNSRLDATLEFAGENRTELERVLEHYRDSGLKYEAARFLIENMPQYYGLRGAATDSGKALLLSMDVNGIILPERIERWQYQASGRMEKVYDARVITADYLIDNIDRAFDAWRKRPWNKHLPFEDFCELILPYRVGNEELEYWRQAYERRYSCLLDSVYRGTDVIEAAAVVADSMKKEGFMYNWQVSLPHLGASFLLDHRMGTCSDACDLTLYVMRALGIPAAIDYYPYCPESRKGHTWNSVRDTTGEHWGLWFTEKRLKRGDVYSDGRKSGKILRKRFAYPQYADASRDYFPDTLRVRVGDRKLDDLYLGIFHPDHHWVVVDVARVKGGEAVFPHVEREVIYAPLRRTKDGDFVEADYPFYFDGKEVHPYVPDQSRQDTVALLRKYPLMTWTAKYMNEIYHGRFEFSNDRNFGRVEYGYVVPDTPRVCYNEVVFPRQVNCRYVRYMAPDSTACTDLAELQFYAGKKRVIPVRTEAAKAENVINVKENMFDDDPLTFYCTWEGGATTWMDFGRQVALDRFVYIPRNDDNFIRIGDEYELFYHDGPKGWVSLGRQTVQEPVLRYKVPRGSLLHLRCLTRGQEELLFHMEDGQQVFVSNLNSVR